MRKLIAELRRRRVFGTSAIYLAGAWGLLEVCNTVFPIVGLPDRAINFVFYGAIVGFPIVLALSWAFDLDLKRTAGSATDDAPPAPQGADASAVVPLKEAPPGSIAVLPFRNIGADPEHEYFSDGLAEELLHTLSSVPGIRVAARTSCFMYKDHHTDVRTIGAQLGVRNVLEGSVRWAGDRIRISTKLIEAGSGYQLMSQKFDEEFKDVFTLQETLANSIVEVLRKSLGETLPAAQASPVVRAETNVEAYQFYLRGRHRWQRRGKEAIEAAVELYEQALALDPTFARAKSALAAARAVMHEYTGESRQASLAAATTLAREAAALDPTLAEPHGVLGYVHLRSWQWQEAESRLLDAIERDPNDPLLRQWYSNVLNDLGKQQEATEQAAKAYELDPVSPMANNVLAVSYMLHGDDRKALKHTRIAREFGVTGLVPAFVEYLANLRNGAWDAAQRDWRAALEKANLPEDWAASVVAAIADPALTDPAVEAVGQAVRDEALPPNIAFLQYVLLGAGDATYAQADALLDEQRLNHTWLMLPEASALRADPRFQTLCAKIGVAEYWQRYGEPALPAGSFEPARAAALTQAVGAA
ncbi:MAG: hypothetical protein AAF184_15215 [Pseudomonadota bacterium]